METIEKAADQLNLWAGMKNTLPDNKCQESENFVMEIGLMRDKNLYKGISSKQRLTFGAAMVLLHVAYMMLLMIICIQQVQSSGRG